MTAPLPSAAEQDRLDVIEATPSAPESFDPYAALRRVQALAEELEAPVFRAAVLLPDRDMGRQEGEDQERRRIAAAIRAALRPADVTGGQR